MNETTHFLNGKFISEEQLLISPRDLGFARGYAVFDFLRTYPHHRPFKLKEHIDRLYASAAAIELSIPWSKEQVTQWIRETLDANKTETEKFIKIIISGGIAGGMLPETEPTIIILVDHAIEYPAWCYGSGITVIASNFTRYRPEAKTNNYIEGIKQMQLGKPMSASEPLYYSDTQVFEGSNSNIFAVLGDTLVTPKSNILKGITRGVLLEILQLPIAVEERDFSFGELQNASEVFYSASGKEITPVTRINDAVVGDGTVGPITKEVMKQYRDYVYSSLWD